MKETKVFKILFIIVTVVLALSIMFDVNAATNEGESNLLTLTTGEGNSTNNATSNTTNNAVNNIVGNTTNNTSNKTNNTVNTTNKTNTTTNTNNNTNSLPHAGIEDHTGLFVVLGVCAVSAFYAYRKTNNYNGIK